MSHPLPSHTVAPRPSGWDLNGDLASWDWQTIAPLSPFIQADGSRPAHWQTVTRVCRDDQALYVRFDCTDEDIWGTHTQRDQAIYNEEVVELFLGAGSEVPVDYYELEVSPNGVLLDVAVRNPTGRRSEMQLDFSWDCPGLRWQAGRDDSQNHWWAVLALPWATVAPAGPLPTTWRANFYRIERPRTGDPEFSCWSPTLAVPANFHVPARFGTLQLAAA